MANRFWVGGSGTWDAATTTHWAATSNGAGGASVPGSGDTVYFDTNSGASAVVTLATNPSIQSVFRTGTTALTLTMGSTAFTLSGYWDFPDTTNLTVSANTATVTLTGNGSSFNGSALNWNGLSVVIAPSTSANIQGGNATLANLTVTGTTNPNGVFELYASPIVTGTFTVTGNSAVNRATIRSATPPTAKTITAGAVSLTNVDFKDITGAGAATWAGTSVGNLGGNTNITFSYGTGARSSVLAVIGMFWYFTRQEPFQDVVNFAEGRTDDPFYV